MRLERAVAEVNVEAFVRSTVIARYQSLTFGREHF